MGRRVFKILICLKQESVKLKIKKNINIFAEMSDIQIS
jgi:hypothetical protein